ncbi:MAG TPA: hypothetical protein VK943_14745, partial [Arenibaculum sp.]|nr:hypothetical protein [Arenibaculum sp.]
MELAPCLACGFLFPAASGSCPRCGAARSRPAGESPALKRKRNGGSDETAPAEDAGDARDAGSESGQRSGKKRKADTPSEPPTPLSSADDFEEDELDCSITCSSHEEEEDEEDQERKEVELEAEDAPPVPLRVMSWNIERLGGPFLYGRPTRRQDAAIEAIAAIIHKADPDVCAVIEVMSYEGGRELGRIVAALNRLSAGAATWDVAVIDGRTGETVGMDDTGETYAVIYKTGDISVEQRRFGEMDGEDDFDWGGFANSRGQVTKYRKPGEIVLRMDGRFAGRSGPWELPVVVFHAPGPRDDPERQAAIEASVHNLGLIEAVARTDRYPDCIVCADLNSSEEASELVDEPKAPVEESGYGFLIDILWEQLNDDDADERTRSAGINEDAEQHASDMVGLEEEEVGQDIDELGRAGKGVRKWVKQQRGILAEARRLENEANDRIGGRLSRGEELSDRLFTEEMQPYLDKLDELDGRLKLKAPYTEDADRILDALTRRVTWRKETIGRVKKELVAGMRALDQETRLESREMAWQALDDAGLQEWVTYDADLRTTRRRTITFLRQGVREAYAELG